MARRPVAASWQRMVASVQAAESVSLRIWFAWPLAPQVSAEQPELRALLDHALQQIPPDTLNQMRVSWSQPPQPDH